MVPGQKGWAIEDSTKQNVTLFRILKNKCEEHKTESHTCIYRKHQMSIKCLSVYLQTSLVPRPLPPKECTLWGEWPGTRLLQYMMTSSLFWWNNNNVILHSWSCHGSVFMYTELSCWAHGVLNLSSIILLQALFSPKNEKDLEWPVILHCSKKQRNKGKCHYPALVSSI